MTTTKGVEPGPRAIAEVGFDRVGAFVAQLMGITPTEEEMKSWVAATLKNAD